MNKKYTDIWNSQVTKDDTVYHLGDFTFGDPTPYLSRLNGKIKIVPGNHDAWTRKRKFQIINSMFGPVEILPPIHVLNLGKRKSAPQIVMCHYPMYTWPHSNHGSWHLHGHSHKELNYTWFAMHVGVDSNAGHLYPLSAVKQRMRELDEAAKNKKSR